MADAREGKVGEQKSVDDDRMNRHVDSQLAKIQRDGGLQVYQAKTTTRAINGIYVISDTAAMMRHRLRQDLASCSS